MASKMPTPNLRIIRSGGKDVLQQRFTTFNGDQWLDVPVFASAAEADAPPKPEPEQPFGRTRTFGSMF